MSVTASQVNELRKKTGAGMMDCKKALTETNGDMEEAIDLLRKKGQKVAAKRGDRDASEGLVIAKVDDNGTKGVLVCLNCETDFVAKNKDFGDFAVGDQAVPKEIILVDVLLEMRRRRPPVIPPGIPSEQLVSPGPRQDDLDEFARQSSNVKIGIGLAHPGLFQVPGKFGETTLHVPCLQDHLVMLGLEFCRHRLGLCPLVEGQLVSGSGT